MIGAYFIFENEEYQIAGYVPHLPGTPTLVVRQSDNHVKLFPLHLIPELRLWDFNAEYLVSVYYDFMNEFYPTVKKNIQNKASNAVKVKRFTKRRDLDMSQEERDFWTDVEAIRRIRE